MLICVTSNMLNVNINRLIGTPKELIDPYLTSFIRLYVTYNLIECLRIGQPWKILMLFVALLAK